MYYYSKAPRLYCSGNNTQQEINKKIEYRIAQDLMDVIFRNLNSKNQIKLMIVLAGTKGDGSFCPAEKWILERTGMQHARYIEARTALCQLGWLSHKKCPTDERYLLTVNYDAIFRYDIEHNKDAKKNFESFSDDSELSHAENVLQSTENVPHSSTECVHIACAKTEPITINKNNNEIINDNFCSMSSSKSKPKYNVDIYSSMSWDEKSEVVEDCLNGLYAPFPQWVNIYLSRLKMNMEKAGNPSPGSPEYSQAVSFSRQFLDGLYVMEW